LPKHHGALFHASAIFPQDAVTMYPFDATRTPNAQEPRSLLHRAPRLRREMPVPRAREAHRGEASRRTAEGLRGGRRAGGDRGGASGRVTPPRHRRLRSTETGLPPEEDYRLPHHAPGSQPGPNRAAGRGLNAILVDVEGCLGAREAWR